MARQLKLLQQQGRSQEASKSLRLWPPPSGLRAKLLTGGRSGLNWPGALLSLQRCSEAASASHEARRTLVATTCTLQSDHPCGSAYREPAIGTLVFFFGAMHTWPSEVEKKHVACMQRAAGLRSAAASWL
eukprot:CAMPEP_0194753282 /NCGR_PEP_ID=MMETSP0323_2-20130528/7243_1 /TAXON_ID=2866 ORGANISM="Crypthecodinium cohnii, Strain Seligo" /NCGR_SAMPLE_ID=MMETSP0323_2 /ASSEMBLY_ACC=CAM_ASM_000346 /LENGTH=129 /DNA_ID=CAMNT_0039671039 /DNA_START=44 /DNA_END=430 /DNA_ORIENTATION=-